MLSPQKILRRIRSFVHRDGRLTVGQETALADLWPQYGLTATDGVLDLNKTFGRASRCIVEIGFGSGQSLLAMAKNHPQDNFIGIEIYRPGIGALLQNMQLQNVDNIRIYATDAVEIFQQCIPKRSIDTVQIFFPDPWPKRKHHKRRLIQPDFINLLLTKLKDGGTLHLATDWEHYAQHMLRVLTAQPTLINCAGDNQYANRSTHRPVITKFEQRGNTDGRAIWELQFSLNAGLSVPA
jgi:tRNA (guanine-N7-)-methyltransferase